MEEDKSQDTSQASKHFSRLILTQEFTFSSSSITSAQPEKLCAEIRNNIVGDKIMFTGPFGERKITYCDYTASGKPVAFIESFIRDVVLPLYANTHTTTSVTGHQTSLLRHEARLLIKRFVNANFSHGNAKDSLLFHGSGVTGCINMLVKSLGLDRPAVSPDRRAVVFVGPYEHHSNLLPWREAIGCEVVAIGATPTGAINVTELEEQLNRYSDRPLRIGSFSAASNVTGILSDTSTISSLLHRYGALSFWDYATAGPYVTIDMNPRSVDPLNYMDAIFLSPHKFLGGPGSPGVLVVKKSLLRGDKPAEPGGGTVFFVTEDSQRYLRKVEERNEAGTQEIIGSIRAALAFKLKASVGEQWIMQREHSLRKMAFDMLGKNRSIILLGSPTQDSLPVISLVVQHPSGRMIHYNFVCALLNDLFGLQLRGGCMCAGPYSEYLLGMSQDLAKLYEKALVAHDESEILRPGFVRFSLHYTMTDEMANFVLRAVDWVATHGWKLLPEYVFERNTGEWYHPNVKKFPGRRWLGDLNFANGTVFYEPLNRDMPADHDINAYFAAAEEVLSNVIDKNRRGQDKRPQLVLVDGTESLRWFLLPQEAAHELSSPSSEQVWDLSKSPLRTFIHAGSAPTSTSSTSGAAAGTASQSSAASELDDFLGVLEDDHAEDADSSAVATSAIVPSSSASTDSTAEGAMCQLRPEFRDPIDIAALSVPKALRGVKWHTPSKKKIWQKTRKAIFDFDMIRPGDKVLVCVSGGKDSLSLLHTLKFLQSKLGFENSFELGAVTVDPMTVSFDPRPLIPYMAALGVTYHYEQQPLIDAAKDANASSICSWCSRMKRGIIYKTARTHGYNVVAMGQHLDDMAESFMMSFWLNGKLRTQKACYIVDEGDLRFCRPFAYVRERHLKEFALEKGLPVISETCPACFAEPKERARLKTLLENQEAIYPNMYFSMCSAMDPLMRNLPITAVDHERQEDMDRKLGKYPRWTPVVLRTATWIGCGILAGLVFAGMAKE